MANTKTKATRKYEEKKGIIAKSYKMPKTLADEFKEVCDSLGLGQAETIRNLMTEFISKNKKM